MDVFPNKSIRLINAAASGGSIDLAARLIAEGISGPLGQPVVVDSHGTGGAMAGEIVAKAPPDGYILLAVSGTLWTAPLLQKVSYDPISDFLPVTLAITQPNILVVHPALPAMSVAELIDLARARPGQLRYASGLTGSPSHLSGALFAYMAGVEMVRIPYKNTAQLGVNDLISGKVQMMIFSAGSAMPHVRSGKLRALAVTSAEQSTLLPDLPTIAATLPGYEAAQPIGIFAPAKTPSPIVRRLNQEMVRFLKTEETKKRLLDAGIEAVGSSPEEFAAKIESEITMLRKLIKEAGIKAE